MSELLVSGGEGVQGGIFFVFFSSEERGKFGGGGGGEFFLGPRSGEKGRGGGEEVYVRLLSSRTTFLRRLIESEQVYFALEEDQGSYCHCLGGWGFD